MRFFKTLLSLAVSTALFTACDKSGSLSLDERSSVGDVTVIASIEKAQALIAGHIASDFESLGDIGPNRSFEDAYEELNIHLDRGEFASELELRAAIDPTIAYVDGANELQPNISATALQKLCTPDGLLAIGDTLYQFGRDDLKAFAFSGDVDAALAAGPLNVRDVQKQVIASREDKKNCDVGTGKKRRMKGELQVNNTAIYNEIKVITKHQRKRLGVWMRSGVSRLEHSYSVEVKNPFNGTWTTVAKDFGRNDEAHISSHPTGNFAMGNIFECNQNYRDFTATHTYPGNAECKTNRCD